ncbi:MAG: phytanoyl-CoA dioxygenase family protein [Hyphomicrobiales bacterium]
MSQSSAIAKPPCGIVSGADIETFHRDGVVHLEGAFDAEWLDLLGRAIDKNMAAPSPRFEARTMDGSEARYCEDFWVWSLFPEFEDFVHRSPAAAIAADLLDAQRINLVMDNWFLREAGARSRPPWHHDIAYFDFDGTMCVLWLPLEVTPKENGIAFVRGSHLWGKLFQRVFFKSHETAGEPGEVNGLIYEPPPDIDADPAAYDLVAFDCKPGDCIMFDMRTLHGALAETVPDRTIRRYTLRMTAQDGRIRYRGDWASGERAIFEAAGHGEGDAIDSAFFPRLWERA